MLQRCCVGHECGSCGGGSAAPPSPEAPELLRDPGEVSGSGVLAPSVLRDLEAVTGRTLERGNAVRVLADGTDSFGAMLDLVRNAKEEVQFENFIFRADPVGRAFAEELRTASAAGVRVRLLHDPVGTVMARRPPADLLFRRSAVEVRLFNLALPIRRSRTLGRDHRKLVVADGTAMVSGGICLADRWAGNCIRHCTWRDTAVYVEGPAAASASATFETMWRHGRRLLSPLPGRRAWDEPVRPKTFESAGDIPVRIVSDLGGDRPTIALLDCVIRAARREILITCPYFIPPPNLAKSLEGAAARGVEVVVLIPGRNNHIVAGLSAEERLGPLLRRGVRVFRWRGPMIHSKSMVVDGAWALVGSSNLDALSLERNAELNVEIHGTAPGGRLAELFREDCRRSAPFTLEDWRHRRLLRKLAGKLASGLAGWQ